MRRETLEFDIVRRVHTGVGNQEHAVTPGRFGEAVEIGQQMFGAGHVQFAAGQHEVCLRIDVPENDVSSYHGNRLGEYGILLL